MALKSTIHRAELEIADLDRPYYGRHALVIARHPSESAERMMVRLLAFALHAGPTLRFGRGLSTEGEPALWDRDADGRILLWIEIGQPDARLVRRACGRAERVCVYNYGGAAADAWWRQAGPRLRSLANLAVVNLPGPAVRALGQVARRSMRLQVTVQDDQVWLGAGEAALQFALERRKALGSVRTA